MHNIPVYKDITHGNREMTVIRKVEGDIWVSGWVGLGLGLTLSGLKGQESFQREGLLAYLICYLPPGPAERCGRFSEPTAGEDTHHPGQ